MIQANELRIGNWVKRSDLDGVFTVRSVSKDRLHPIDLIEHDKIENVHYACECTLSELEPIPLSPDILEKCGFENVYENKWANDLVEIQHYELGDWYELLNGEERTNWTHQVKYVHQLQNLYYSLTNQELNIHL